MKLSVQIVAVATLGALAIGFASAAPKPTAVPSHSGGASSCTTVPTAEQCLAKGYLETRCGKVHASTCRPHVEGALKADYEANPSETVKMLRPNQTEMPVHLRDGKVVDYPGPRTKARMVGTFPKVTKLGKAVAKPAGSPTLAPRTLSTLPPSATATKAVTAMGKTRPKYSLAPKPGKRGARTQTSDNIFARTGLTRPPHSGLLGLPVDAHRNPKWDQNGEQIGSCEEYAYEKVYDWARYTDAVAACAGDRNCQLDIAFLPNTPGIASRTLKRKDGKPLATQITYSKKLELPKNDLFAYGAKFVYAGGAEGIAQSADLDALAAVLKDGEVGYTIGCSGACRAGEYTDEWDFHRKMHDANRTVSLAEHEEYERRKARFRELAGQYQAAVAAEKEKLLGGRPKKGLAWVNPIDIVTANPIERMNMMRGAAGEMRRSSKKISDALGSSKVKGMPGAGVKNKPVVGGAALQQHSAVDRGVFDHAPRFDFDGGGAAPTGVLAAPTAKATKPSSIGKPSAGGGKGKPQPTPGSSQNTDAAKTKPESEAFMCDPKKFTKIFETFGMGPISCEIGRFLRAEWRRKQAGHKSCLDPDNDDCDWSPMMFEARFVEGVPYIGEQNRYETRCIDYTGDKFAPAAANITAADAYIEAMRAKIAEAMRILAPYKKAKTESGLGKGFGKEFTDADHFGDKDWFAAGYDYALGWDVEPVQVDGSNVCQLGGGARGGFGIDGWFVGGQFEVVDALALADYNRAGDKQGVVKAHLNLFEGAVKVIDPQVDEHFSGAWEKPVARGGIDIPMGYKPSFTFMAGPVPVTGAVWGEFFYGARLQLDPKTEASCDMSKMTFGANVTFTPEVGLNAKAQVGVGISGLLSIGVRGLVNLITVGIPVEIGLATKLTQVESQVQTSLGFSLDVRLSLATLSGWLALYMEVLFFEEEFILFRWNGLGPESISLLGQPLTTELPLFVMATE